MTTTTMLIVAVSSLASVVVALAGAVAFLGRRSLNRADEIAASAITRAREIEDNALARWDEQTKALEKVAESLRCNTATVERVALSLANHDETNGRAHREASEILSGVAKLQRKTLDQLEAK